MQRIRMTVEVQVQQDGRILRIYFNRPLYTAVSDPMALAQSQAMNVAHELGFISKVYPTSKLQQKVVDFIQFLLSRSRPVILGLKKYTHNASKMVEDGVIN